MRNKALVLVPCVLLACIAAQQREEARVKDAAPPPPAEAKAPAASAEPAATPVAVAAPAPERRLAPPRVLDSREAAKKHAEAEPMAADDLAVEGGVVGLVTGGTVGGTVGGSPSGVGSGVSSVGSGVSSVGSGLSGVGSGLSGVGVGGGGLGSLGVVGRGGVPRTVAVAVSEPPRSAGLQAGSSDDNLTFNAFASFLRDHASLGLPHDVSQRLVIEVHDAAGLPVLGAAVIALDAKGRTLAARRTYADGRALLFPSELHVQDGKIRVEYGGAAQVLQLAGPHQRAVQLDVKRAEAQRVPLDVAFILDTTGSMGDEIERLRQTLDVIHFQLTHLDPAPEVRFALVEYKDRGDDPVVRATPFTANLEQFRATLQGLRAGGGGDEPEDVQAGLEQALHGLAWREQGVKVAFLIGDAPPHLDYGEKYTYLDAAREAAQRGIKIAAVGCSGLPLRGEVVWREIAQYTMAPYVFLSRGERGDMEGSASSVSHHVGSNWVAENLETIVVRMVKSELAHLQPRLVAQQQDYFKAQARGEAEGVLRDLFKQSVKQLVDYSVERIDDPTATVVLPLSVKSAALQGAAARLQSRLESGVSGTAPFKLLQSGARLAVQGQLAEDGKGDPELLVKLTRLETGELLSLSLLKIDRALLQ